MLNTLQKRYIARDHQGLCASIRFQRSTQRQREWHVAAVCNVATRVGATRSGGQERRRAIVAGDVARAYQPLDALLGAVERAHKQRRQLTERRRYFATAGLRQCHCKQSLGVGLPRRLLVVRVQLCTTSDYQTSRLTRQTLHY
jgi:hypothetical protein